MKSSKAILEETFCINLIKENFFKISIKVIQN